MPWQTLGEHLRLQAPPVASRRKRLVVNANLNYQEISRWTVWEDFNYENMRASLGQYLNTEDNFEPPAIQDGHLYLTDEKGLDHLISSWHCLIVNKALNAIREEDARTGREDDRLPSRLHMASGWMFEGGRSEKEGGGGKIALHPDWAGAIVNSLEDLHNIIPGDSKLTHVEFEDEYEKVQDRDQKLRDADPPGTRRGRDEVSSWYKRECLARVAAYACYLKTRYAYIITNRQVIFVRVSRDAETFERRRYHQDKTPNSKIPKNPRGTHEIGSELHFSSALKGSQTGLEYLGSGPYTPSRNPAGLPLPRPRASSNMGTIPESVDLNSSDSEFPLPDFNLNRTEQGAPPVNAQSSNSAVPPSTIMSDPNRSLFGTSTADVHRQAVAGNARRFTERSSPISPDGQSKRANTAQTPIGSPGRSASLSRPRPDDLVNPRSPGPSTSWGRTVTEPPCVPSEDPATPARSSNPTARTPGSGAAPTESTDDENKDPTYVDYSQPDFDIDCVEIAVIPWENREGEMTILEGLVWINYLAGLETRIEDCYAPLYVPRDDLPEEETSQTDDEPSQASDLPSQMDDVIVSGGNDSSQVDDETDQGEDDSSETDDEMMMDDE